MSRELIGDWESATTSLQVREYPVAALAMQRLEMLPEQLFVVHLDLQGAGFLSNRFGGVGVGCCDGRRRARLIGARPH